MKKNNSNLSFLVVMLTFFTMGFVANILQGKSIREAHEMAVKVSAFVCTQAGAMPTYK